MFLPAAAVALVSLSAAQAKPPKPFVLKDGDRVVWIGNTLAEREQRYGYWETALHAAYPTANFTVRNLGWSGDTVWGEARAGFDPPAKGYERLISLTKELKPTVILVSYGTNESFAGPDGVARFNAGLMKLLDDLKGTEARFVLMSPVPFEKAAGGPDPWAAPEGGLAKNEVLRKYAAAVYDAADRRNDRFVDLFTHLARHERRSRDTRFTDNGIHLTADGYRATIPDLLAEFGLPDEGQDWDRLDALRKAVVEKNQLFFYRWRPQNETYLFGFRKHEQGKNAKEVAEFDPLVAAAEKKVADLKAKLLK